jgi:hypothetical protein
LGVCAQGGPAKFGFAIKSFMRLGFVGVLLHCKKASFCTAKKSFYCTAKRHLFALQKELFHVKHILLTH